MGWKKVIFFHTEMTADSSREENGFKFDSREMIGSARSWQNLIDLDAMRCSRKDLVSDVVTRTLMRECGPTTNDGCGQQ